MAGRRRQFEAPRLHRTGSKAGGLLLLMTRTKPGRALLAFVVTLVVALSVAPAAGAADGTESLPVGFELQAIAVGPAGEGFAALTHSLQVGVEIAEGTHVFEISPAGEATEFPTVFPKGTAAGAAGIVAGPEGSVWIPVEHGLVRVDSDGIEDEVQLGGGEVERLSTDHKGGAWVIAGQQAVHVTADGSTHALNLAQLRLAGTPYAGPAGLVDDGRGDLWIAVARGREEAAKELVERTPSGQLRQFRIPRRLSGYPGAAGLWRDRPMLESGDLFLELDPDRGRFEAFRRTDRECRLTETRGVWCQGWIAVYRAFPHGDPPPPSLPHEASRLGELAEGPDGRLWYGSQVSSDGDPKLGGCHEGPCGTVAVGPLSPTG
jgi:hypothetical protein